MSLSKVAMILVSGTLVAAAGTVALAHQNSDSWWPNWGFGHMMEGRGMGGHMMGQDGHGWMYKRTDGRLAFLKTELKITEKQAAAWNKLAETIRTTSETHRDMMKSRMEEHRSGEFIKKPLTERLAYQQTHLEARLEQVKSVSEAVDGLYAVLDATQKKVADEIVLPMMGMGGGMGGRMMMH
ncbi:MAG: Spy/CpxP family protein refolding chaperone [Geminicoccales bacterium]